LYRTDVEDQLAQRIILGHLLLQIELRAQLESHQSLKESLHARIQHVDEVGHLQLLEKILLHRHLHLRQWPSKTILLFYTILRRILIRSSFLIWLRLHLHLQIQPRCQLASGGGSLQVQMSVLHRQTPLQLQ
jgi:hypothetical protein